MKTLQFCWPSRLQNTTTSNVSRARWENRNLICFMERNAFIYQWHMKNGDENKRTTTTRIEHRATEIGRNDKKFNDKIRSKTNFPTFYYDYLFWYSSFFKQHKYVFFLSLFNSNLFGILFNRLRL